MSLLEASGLRDDEDLALVARMAAGDERALRILFDRWQPALLVVVRRIVAEQSAADDVLLETFWQAWQHARRHDPARGPVGAWLRTIARSRALDHRRAERRRETVPLDHAPGDRLAHDSGMDARVELADDVARVRAAVATLPPAQQHVIMLTFAEGLSHAEVAARTGWPIGTVKSRVRLALRRLRHAVAPAALATGSGRNMASDAD
ncbi:MAG: sigma-70 family RNA polymerase sigma factor [Gemmatimonadaceae bacterium]|nr:sigma-70 family RNA polymerase sigma factor [Gemmatimonadaceae bacterium]